MKKALSVLLCICMVLSVFTALPLAALAATLDEANEPVGASSGTTGDCTWTLDDSGVLTISGSGEMGSYTNNTSPWGRNITSVIIHAGVTSVGEYAFCGCTGLTSVTIGDSVTSIGNSAFYNCTGLTSATIGDSVTSIGEAAFCDCTGLTSVTLPDSVTSVGACAFYGCEGLASVIIPDNVASIGYYAFQNTAWYINQPDGLFYIGKVAYKYKGTMPFNTSIKIKDGTKEIADEAFQNNTGLTSVTIPDSVTNIGYYSFYNCTALSSVIIPDSVTSIGYYAFQNTAWYNNQPDGLIYAGKVAYEYKGIMPDNTSIVIKTGIKEITNNAFYSCHGLKSVTIPDSVTSIGGGTFQFCTNLTNVTIPDSMTSIGNSAFSGCTGLTSVTIPDSVTRIGDFAFSGCTGLTSVTIPNNVKCIGSSTFSYCTSLKRVTIPDNVMQIDDHAFFYCTDLTSVTIPDRVTRIGNYAFVGCTELTNICVNENNPVYDSRYNCNAIIRTADNTLIVGCQNTVIPDSVTSIGACAFQDCTGLTSTTIPNSVTSIGYSAFYGCDALQDVYYGGSNEDWDKIAIYDYNDPLINARIHCQGYETKHVIESKYGDYRQFTFGYGEEIEDLVFSQSSSAYNPRLAHFLACMARSAYTQDLVGKNYAELGFGRYYQYHYEDLDPYAAYTIGERSLDNGNKLVMITIRGTNDISEWLDTNFNLGNSALLTSVGLHSGFLASANQVYDSLKSYLGGSIAKSGVTYIITGHSLGAAAGNILAEKLFLDGVPNQNVYDYNFACPNVGMGADDISAWNHQGEHNNIINVSNWCDQVSHLPGLGTEYLSGGNRDLCAAKGWTKWKRFGVSYWFDNGFHLFVQAHDMETYLDYLEKEYDASRFRDKEYEVTAVLGMCPVDIVIYDKAGYPIAGTENNQPNYYGHEIGENALILVNGDRKLFYINGIDDYHVALSGTDTGEMELRVSSENLTIGETASEKWFSDVQLTDGKEMICSLPDYLSAYDSQLFIVDENDKQIKEILADGTEVNPIFASENKLILPCCVSVTLTAESKDTYRWYSTDDSIAMVENGVVTIHANGEANIIAETVNGARAICHVSSYVIGDTDNDSIINIRDVTAIQRHIAELNLLTEKQLAAADTNGDGKVDITDATHLQMYLAEYGVKLG